MQIPAQGLSKTLRSPAKLLYYYSCTEAKNEQPVAGIDSTQIGRLISQIAESCPQVFLASAGSAASSSIKAPIGLAIAWLGGLARVKAFKRTTAHTELGNP